MNGMESDVVVSTGPFRNIGLSKAAQTHRLRKLRTPAKCRECDSYVYFQGGECEEVSIYFIRIYVFFVSIFILLLKLLYFVCNIKVFNPCYRYQKLYTYTKLCLFFSCI